MFLVCRNLAFRILAHEISARRILAHKILARKFWPIQFPPPLCGPKFYARKFFWPRIVSLGTLVYDYEIGFLAIFRSVLGFRQNKKNWNIYLDHFGTFLFTKCL